MTSPQRPMSLLAQLGTPDPAPPWGLGAVIISVGVLLAGLMLIGSVVALTWLPDQPYAALVGWCIGGLVGVAFVVQTRPRAKNAAALGLETAGPPTPFVLFLSLGIAIALDLVSAAVSGAFLAIPELYGLNLRATGIIGWLVVLVFMVLIQPISEGVILRGLALPALRSAFGGYIGLLLTAALSGMIHFVAYPPAYPPENTPLTPLWYGLIAPGLAGLYFCIVRIRTGSTRAAIAAQAAFGLFAVLKLFVLS